MTDKTIPWAWDEMMRYGKYRLYYRWPKREPVDNAEVFMPGGEIRTFGELRRRAQLYGCRCLSPARPRHVSWTVR